MSEKFDELNEPIESLGSEVSDADLPKNRGRLASGVRTLIFLVVAAVGGATINGCCTFKPIQPDCRAIADKLGNLKKEWLDDLDVKKEGSQVDGSDVRFGEGGTKKDAIENAKRKLKLRDAIEDAKRKLKLPEGKVVDLSIRTVQVRGKVPDIPVVIDTSVEAETNAGNLIADCAREKIGEWIGCGSCSDLPSYVLSETDVCGGPEVKHSELRRGDIINFWHDKNNSDGGSDHVAIIEKVYDEKSGLIWHQNMNGSPVIRAGVNFTGGKGVMRFFRPQNSQWFLAMVHGKLNLKVIKQELLEILGAEKTGRQKDGSVVQIVKIKSDIEAKVKKNELHRLAIKSFKKSVGKMAAKFVNFESEAVQLPGEGQWLVCIKGIPKAPKVATSVSVNNNVTELTSLEARKDDPWKMDLKKMVEAVRTNFSKGVDPFKEMGRKQPDLFLCDTIPKKHTDKFGISKNLSSVVFQMSQLVDEGMKNRINAEKGRLKKLPHVVRLLNIAGYKSFDDKIKHVRKKVKAGPENTREWHALAMDLLDLVNATVDSVADLDFSDDPKKKNKKKDKSLKKLHSFAKKILGKVRASLGYHGNLNEKQWKKLVNTMLKESGGLLKLVRGLGVFDGYVPPRNIDFNKIPDNYHTKVKKAIEILEALEKDSKPNVERWKGLQERMTELSGRVKSTVNMEASMGKKRKRCAQSPEPIEVASLGMMQETRGSVDSENPDYYSEVPQIARPLPYHCSWIDPEHGRGSSVVLAAKELEERVKAHIEAMSQRLEAYAYAGRFAGIVEKANLKKRFKIIASGSKRGDEILGEWMEILEVLVVLRQDLEKAASAELRIAMDLRRCNVPVTALKQAVKRNDKQGVYTELLRKLNRTGEGLTNGVYVTVVSAQSENEAKDMAYRSAISTFAGREIKRAVPRESKNGKYQIIVFNNIKNNIKVIVEKLKVIEMPNGHAMCGIVARLATPADLKLKSSKATKAPSKKAKKKKGKKK